mgnify:CR=1 FL=1
MWNNFLPTSPQLLMGQPRRTHTGFSRGVVFGVHWPGAEPHYGRRAAGSLHLLSACGHQLILLGAVYTSAVAGGSISAILLSIPGAPSSIATLFDGYPMAKQGRAQEPSTPFL